MIWKFYTILSFLEITYTTNDKLASTYFILKKVPICKSICWINWLLIFGIKLEQFVLNLLWQVYIRYVTQTDFQTRNLNSNDTFDLCYFLEANTKCFNSE